SSTPPTDISTISLHDALPILESLVKYINKHIYNKRSALLVIAEGAVSEENHALGLKPKKHAEAIKIVDAIPELTGMQARLTTLRSEEHTSELQSRFDLVCRLL